MSRILASAYKYGKPYVTIRSNAEISVVIRQATPDDALVEERDEGIEFMRVEGGDERLSIAWHRGHLAPPNPAAPSGDYNDPRLSRVPRTGRGRFRSEDGRFDHHDEDDGHGQHDHAR